MIACIFRQKLVNSLPREIFIKTTQHTVSLYNASIHYVISITESVRYYMLQMYFLIRPLKYRAASYSKAALYAYAFLYTKNAFCKEQQPGT
jgi:hypothetical protein